MKTIKELEFEKEKCRPNMDRRIGKTHYNTLEIYIKALKDVLGLIDEDIKGEKRYLESAKKRCKSHIRIFEYSISYLKELKKRING